MVAAVALAAATIIFFFAPAVQDHAYHDFADRRMGWGIPNFWDVVSNLPFLLVGGAGLWIIFRGRTPGVLPGLKSAYALFFAGVALVAFGSAYYHWEPNAERLVWDRMPMTIAFTALFAIVLEEQLGCGARWLWPMVIAGLASVGYWAATGDVRWYGMVQFLPVVLVPLLLWLFPSRVGNTRYFWGLVLCYLAAKVFEWGDRECLEQLGWISGHTLKHFAAAAGTALVLLAACRRTVTSSS